MTTLQTTFDDDFAPLTVNVGEREAYAARKMLATADSWTLAKHADGSATLTVDGQTFECESTSVAVNVIMGSL